MRVRGSFLSHHRQVSRSSIEAATQQYLWLLAKGKPLALTHTMLPFTTEPATIPRSEPAQLRIHARAWWAERYRRQQPPRLQLQAQRARQAPAAATAAASAAAPCRVLGCQHQPAEPSGLQWTVAGRVETTGRTSRRSKRRHRLQPPPHQLRRPRHPPHQLVGRSQG